MNLRTACLTLFAPFLLAAPATAQVTWYFDRPTFEAIVPDLDNEEDFEGAAIGPGLAAPAADPLWAGSTDPFLSLGDIEGGLRVRSSDSDLMYVGASNPLIQNPTQVVGPTWPGAYVKLLFSNGAHAVGVKCGTSETPDLLQVRVYDRAGTLRDSTVVSASLGNPQFVGVQSATFEIHRIEVESLPGGFEAVDNIIFDGQASPVLASDIEKLVVGSNVTLALSEGTPGAPALLYIMRVDGIPLVLPLASAVVPPLGVIRLQSIVPPAPSGTTVDLLAYSLDAGGNVVATNLHTVRYQ